MRVARQLGAEALYVFVHDPELEALLPAPGFQQTLPGGPEWVAFLARCARPGEHRGQVAYPVRGTLAPVTAVSSTEGTVFALVGGAPEPGPPEELELELLGALLRAEQAVVVARGRSEAAREAARHATALATALDEARGDVERALRGNQELLLRTRESEARKAAVLKSSLDGVITVDAHAQVLEFSDAAERMFGVSRQEQLGSDLSELIVWPDPTPTEPVWLARALAVEGIPLLGRRLELLARRPDGTTFPVEVAITRIELEGPPTFTAFVRDITERKRADAERERLLGIVGHDLRNPLQAITMNVALLLKRGELPEGHAKALRRVQTSADRMSRMIGDLLDFERSRHGGLALDRKPGRVRDILGQVVEELEVAHPTRAIVISRSGDGDGQWDADRLSQAISNLVGNALQHGPAEEPVLVSLAERDQAVVLEVSNRNRAGPIPPDELPRLFEPFRRGKQSTGLGLGLYIVQQIAQAHAGRVEASSQQEGTTFRITLPREGAVTPPRTSAAPG